MTKLIDEKLLTEMNLARQIVEKGLAARAEAGIKIRQPLAGYTSALAKGLADGLVELVKDELNVKNVEFGANDKLDIELTDELKKEGLVREVVRQINQLRKEAKLTIADKVVIYQAGLNDLFAVYAEEIKKGTAAQKIENDEIEGMKEIEGGKVGIKKI